MYIYIYDPHIWPLASGRLVLGGREGGIQTPDFQKKCGVPPDSRLQISRKNLEYPKTPDSRFPEKIWSTNKLQIPDFQKESGVPPDSRLQISRKNLEYRDPGLQILESAIWSLGRRVLQNFFLEIWSLKPPGTPDFSGNLESVRVLQMFLEIWSLESGAPVLQIFSGNLESGARVLQIFSGNLKSGVRGPCSPYARLGFTV